MWEKVERGCSHRAVTRLGWGKDKVCETCKWASDPIWTFRKKIKNLSSVNFFFFLLNWRIIALQCCAGLCNKPMQISHNYICVLCTLGKTNEAGQRQKEFCPEKALVIANTLFQEHKTLHMDIIRWSTPKLDWFYSLQAKMEKLYAVSKNKIRRWLWLKSWTPYCQIQT